MSGVERMPELLSAIRRASADLNSIVDRANAIYAHIESQLNESGVGSSAQIQMTETDSEGFPANLGQIRYERIGGRMRIGFTRMSGADQPVAWDQAGRITKLEGLAYLYPLVLGLFNSINWQLDKAREERVLALLDRLSPKSGQSKGSK